MQINVQLSMQISTRPMRYTFGIKHKTPLETYDQLKLKQYSLMQVTTVGLHRFICMHMQNDKQNLKYNS